jgi:hypothetical protein
MTHEIATISKLLSINEVRHISQALALADAIIMPEWEYRYFSFNNMWDVKGAEAMASMRDGSGEEYFLHFVKEGVVGKVLAETALPSALQQLHLVPDCFSGFKTEPAFKLDHASFYFWREAVDAGWHSSPAILNSYPLLAFLTGGESYYSAWAQEYYERPVDTSIVSEIFTSLTVSSNQLNILNPNITLEQLKDDVKQILG